MITKNFIKQCEQATELQVWYKSDVKNVHEGDRYICKCDTCKKYMFINIVKDYDIDYINKRDMTNADPIYKEMVTLSGVGEFGAFWNDKGFIYLPTLERLFEMVDWDKAINNSTNIINNTWKRECREGCKLYLLFNFYKDGISNRFDTIKEILFAFVMKEKYHKVWTGKKWKKEEE